LDDAKAGKRQKLANAHVITLDDAKAGKRQKLAKAAEESDESENDAREDGQDSSNDEDEEREDGEREDEEREDEEREDEEREDRQVQDEEHEESPRAKVDEHPTGSRRARRSMLKKLQQVVDDMGPRANTMKSRVPELVDRYGTVLSRYRIDLKHLVELAENSPWLEAFLETGWPPQGSSAEDWLDEQVVRARVAVVAASVHALDSYAKDENHNSGHNDRCAWNSNLFRQGAHHSASLMTAPFWFGLRLVLRKKTANKWEIFIWGDQRFGEMCSKGARPL
jgi:hypothetical protein